MTRWSATPRRAPCSTPAGFATGCRSAQPSEKVQVLLNKAGIKKPAPGEPWQLSETPAPVEAPAPAPADSEAQAPAPPPTS